jgi:hypothetical protein
MFVKYVMYVMILVGWDVYEVVDSETVSEAVANVLQFLVAPGR